MRNFVHPDHARFLAQPDDESALLVYIKVNVLTNGQMQELRDDGNQEPRARIAGFFLGIAYAGLLNVTKLNAELDAEE